MIAWWEARTRREQALLAVMAATLSAFLLWFGVHRPVAQAREAAAQRYERALRAQGEVEAAAARIRQLQKGGASSARRAPAAEAVNASAAATGLTLSRVSPDPGGGVQVAVGGVSPAQLFPWLASLQQDYGVTARHLTVVKDDQGGLAMDATFADEGR
ncbi:type II secretion system protein GspM [Phenylobacterium sp.]|uniref:type II secretion system protein GspM n=1 Tax=Phenylobacterium sp. TaxID=1871053 RepID=UPI00281244CE|nr:type II secretion system protein GspM [Phenylobacterium sp.]